MNPPADQPLTGTIAGTALVLLLQVAPGELLKAMLLAAIGATVSFTISCLLKKITGHK